MKSEEDPRRKIVNDMFEIIREKEQQAKKQERERIYREWLDFLKNDLHMKDEKYVNRKAVGEKRNELKKKLKEEKEE